MTNQEKATWADKLAAHLINQTGCYESLLKRGLAELKAEHCARVRARNHWFRLVEFMGEA